MFWTPLHLELDDPFKQQQQYTYTTINNNMAEHASIADSDIDIGSHAGTLDLTGNDAVNHPADRGDARRSFNGPMIHQNKTSILGWFAVGILFAIAIGLSASSWQKSNEALQIAENNAKAIETSNEKLISIEEIAESSTTNNGGGVQQQPIQPAQPTPAQLIPVTPPPTPPPTTGKPTEPHPLNPKWFQTTHADYQEMVDAYDEAGSDLHSYYLALQVCTRNKRKLCDYDVYCPNGQGSPPFGGGPPQTFNYDSLETTQWAPYQHGNDEPLNNDPAYTKWVQIGKMDEDNGGKEGNDFVECWKYDDWYANSGEDIEDGWGEEHRMWMLCCETEPTTVDAPSTPAEPSPAEPTGVVVEAPTDEPHPLNPRWIQTTHDDYQMFDEMDPQAHSYRVAQNTCHKQKLMLCEYEVYCPNGQGNQVFQGGPQAINSDELEETQWAPYNKRDTGWENDWAWSEWVQIGKISSDNGGKEENNFGMCFSFDDWYVGTDKENIEEEWGEEHTMWMLCCETEPVAGAPTPAEPTVVETPTSDTTELQHPLRPKWIQTTHEDYQALSDSHEEQGVHSYRTAQMTCSEQGLELCDYDVYCPNGQGTDPFGGGPPSGLSDGLEETQWAPYMQEDGKQFQADPSWSEWVQIGKMSADKGGDEDNDFVKCYKFDDWYQGTKNNVEDEWGEEHTMWILCCEKEPVAVAPTPAQPTVVETPTDPDHHPLKPQWIQTSHEDYQLIDESCPACHSYHVALNTCSLRGLSLCEYDTYCPNGKGNEVFNGGPPPVFNSDELEETQWAPYFQRDYGEWETDPSWSEWVQIGKISADKGGKDENDFGMCYMFDDWYEGGTEENIEEEWGEEHTMWILCCETEPVAAPTVAEPPTDPEQHPFKPQWFQTTHEDYQETLDAYEESGTDMHSYRIAQTTCLKQGLVLCNYDAYCPNGFGSDPFGGGPPSDLSDGLEETQWAPYRHGSEDTFRDDPAWSEWVQIGKMSAKDGGNEDNDFVKCYKFDEWYQGTKENIEDEWGEEHTMWILCCEMKPVDATQPALPAPTEPAPIPPAPEPAEHPLNPKWYQTTHKDYQDSLAMDASVNATSHSYATAWKLCLKQDSKTLCPLETYCPNGEGGAPFDGGPPELANSADLDATQWAPYWIENAQHTFETSWVQIGEMSSEDGGNEGNDFLKCWTYDEWYAGNGVDIETVWGEEHTMWILCCDDPSTQPALPATPTEAAPASPPASGPTGRNPKWYQTTHKDFQSQVEINEAVGSDFHSYNTAWVLCSRQDGKALCPYEEYCPNGQGGEPFGGGPPQLHNHASLEENQWAPYWVQGANNELAKTKWVQVGIMPGSEGGNDDNDFLQCWKYEDWTPASVVDIEEKWMDEHRVWILCCDEEV